MTATVVMAQRKTKCLMLRSYCDSWLYQMRPRNSLRITRCAVNELKSSTPLNLCRKRTKLSKPKLEEDRQKPAGRPPKWKSKKRRRRPGHRPHEKAPHPFARKVRLYEKEESRCPRGQVEQRSRRTRKFACAPTLFRNDAADSRCRATRIRIGWKPSANSFPNQAHADVEAGVSPIIARLLETGDCFKL